MPPRSRRRRRLLVTGILAATVLPLAGAAVVQFRADASWRTMQEQLRTLREELAGRDHRRPTLWGDTGDGSAFDHYQRALTAARSVEADTAHGRQRPGMVELLRRSPAELAADVALRSAWQPALAALHDGSHAADALPPPWRSGELPSAIADLLECRTLANYAMAEARAKCHEGRFVAAVQQALDAAQFGADLLHRGLLINQMIACAVIAIGTEWSEASLATLDPAALELLATGLERLDRRLPLTLDHESELLYLAAHLQQATSGEAALPTLSTWRHGFSSRWLLAEAFVLASDVVRDLRQAQHLDWPQREALLELECSAVAAAANPVAAMMIPNLTAAETNLRQVLTRLRLLRMAVDLHRGLDVPPLRDPLGDGPLLVTKVPAGIRLASAADGDNHPLSRIVER
jgi:hypothetical protein